MMTAQWSSELPSIVAALKQLTPRELVSRLADSQFIRSWNVTVSERQAIMKAFSGEEKKANVSASVELFWSS